MKNLEKVYGKLAEEIHESGVVESEKQEYDFDMDLVLKQAHEIDILRQQLSNWKKYAHYWKFKYHKANEKKHLYKVEMERLRRKLTRIYNWISRPQNHKSIEIHEGWEDVVIAIFKQL